MTSQARVELSSDGVKAYDAKGDLQFEVEVPKSDPVTPWAVPMCDSEDAAYKAGFNKGYKSGFADCAEGSEFRGDVI